MEVLYMNDNITNVGECIYLYLYQEYYSYPRKMNSDKVKNKNKKKDCVCLHSFCGKHRSTSPHTTHSPSGPAPPPPG